MALFEELQAKRRRWVEANRENGFEEGIKNFLSELYPDQAHFIYELLQNAEDAKATEIHFILSSNQLMCRHNGRSFEIKDIESITSIGNSTKQEDYTRIGKFGVGFKSVFVYTQSPEIHSDEYHFEIQDLVVPESTQPHACGQETCFIFPFDRPQKQPETACAEIEQHLKALDEATLLFLKHICQITYELPDRSRGSLMRRSVKDQQIEITLQSAGESETVCKHFLRFEKQVEIEDEEKKLKQLQVAIAFLADSIPSIQPLNPGKVCIYFPAVKETSGLAFHIHAPFASTVARDSIKDCAENDALRDGLAELTAESLVAIRELGWLDVNFLDVLPNDSDTLDAFYLPIQERIAQVFQEEDLVPMQNGKYSAASGIFKGSKQLISLISDQDLAMLLGEDYFPPMWIERPKRNSRGEQFLKQLDIEEWDESDLIQALESDSELIEKLMKKKSLAWHQRLYALLDSFIDKGSSRIEQIKKVPLVRLKDGSYSTGDSSYFPDKSSAKSEDMPELPRVAKGTYSSGTSEEDKDQQKKAKQFLKKMGVREVEEKVLIEHLLKEHYNSPDVKRNEKAYFEDLKRFISLLDKHSSAKSLFGDYYIFKMENDSWGKVSDIYLDAPFAETYLSAYYPIWNYTFRSSKKFALSQEFYKNANELTLSEIGGFASLVGAKTELAICRAPCRENPDYWSLNSRTGERYTYHIDSDYTILGIKEILQNPTEKLARLLWETMKSLSEHYFKATYQKNERRGRAYAPSQLIHHLKSTAWVPQTSDESDQLEFVKPTDADSGRLPEGFAFDSGWKWLKGIEFGVRFKSRAELERRQVAKLAELNQQQQNEEGNKDEKTPSEAMQAAKKLGFESPEDAEEANKLLQEKRRSTEDNKPAFPERPVKNPERRQGKNRENYSNSSPKSYSPRQRQIRDSKAHTDQKTWLHEMYTNDDNQMLCQLCQKEMPFKTKKGEPYFEAVESLSKTFFVKEHEAQYLALCPLCAAKYKEFVKNDLSNMNEIYQLFRQTDIGQQLLIPVTLNQEHISLRFVEQHLFDIQDILTFEANPVSCVSQDE